MEKLSQFKKHAPLIAAIACLLYEAFSLSGDGSFINGVIYVAILVAGLCCILEKPKVDLIGVGALGVAGVFSFFGLIRDLINICRFASDYSGAWIGQQIFFLFLGIIKFVAIAGLAALAFFYLKKQTNVITKYWYAPAALIVIYAVLAFFFSMMFFFINYSETTIFGVAINTGKYVFDYFMGLFGSLFTRLILAVGLAAIGIFTYSKSE